MSQGTNMNSAKPSRKSATRRHLPAVTDPSHGHTVKETPDSYSMQRWLADSPRRDYDQVRQVVQAWEVIEPQTRQADPRVDFLTPEVNPESVQNGEATSFMDESLIAHAGAWTYRTRGVTSSNDKRLAQGVGERVES